MIQAIFRHVFFVSPENVDLSISDEKHGSEEFFGYIDVGDKW